MPISSDDYMNSIRIPPDSTVDLYQPHVGAHLPAYDRLGVESRLDAEVSTLHQTKDGRAAGAK